MRNAAPMVVALVMTGALTASTLAQVPGRSDIVVAGRGAVATTPDRASVIVEVLTTASSPHDAAASNAGQMTSVMAALARMGYAAESISTISYSVQPTYRYREGQQEHTGYSATNAIVVRVDSIAAVGSVLDGVLAAGATRIRSVRFESSRARELREQAMEEAVADARRSAEVLARAAGGQLGELVLLSAEYPLQGRSYEMESMDVELPSMQLQSITPVLPGDPGVNVVVYARWRFVSR